MTYAEAVVDIALQKQLFSGLWCPLELCAQLGTIRKLDVNMTE